MKKLLFIFASSILLMPARSQNIDNKEISGSWINSNVVDFFQPGSGHSCALKQFGSDEYIPLYLSFEDHDIVKITFRLEQKVLAYKVNYKSSDSFYIVRGNNVHRLYLMPDGALTLFYFGKKLVFKRVSVKFSNEVFRDFIKSKIFENHSSFKLSFVKKPYINIATRITRDNLEQQLKGIFQCNSAEIVQLASLKSDDSCLPEIAIYGGKDTKMQGPIVFGIVINNDKIQLVDASQTVVLELKPI